MDGENAKDVVEVVIMEHAIASETLGIYKDEELVELIRDGEDFALEFLMNKYKRLVEKKSKSYFLIGAGKDDLIQEGMIGLFKAIRDYRNDREASFYSFADLCVTRQMISAVKASTRQKHMPLNTYISLNRPMFEDENENSSLEDRMPSSKIINPEDILIGKENRHLIENELSKKLSRFEKEVLSFYIEGISYVEIAEILDRPIKSVDNALQRIKKKVEQIITDSVTD
jgi:RNA polymerase sporulation-specific sigma factor